MIRPFLAYIFSHFPLYTRNKPLGIHFFQKKKRRMAAA
ncbi:hypothetical protein CHCC20375_2119 [Bacillus licheniformis]|nr:hypothetical protein CHCC20375_2119 [Bacillus licheniformis]